MMGEAEVSQALNDLSLIRNRWETIALTREVNHDWVRRAARLLGTTTLP